LMSLSARVFGAALAPKPAAARRSCGLTRSVFRFGLSRVAFAPVRPFSLSLCAPLPRALYGGAPALSAHDNPSSRNRLYDHATTILTIRRNGQVIVIGDGQVSMGPTVVKANIRKVHRINNGKVLIGFAGSSADAISLMERLEQKLEQYPDQLLRAAVELTKDWRMDKVLRHLDAQMIAVDKEVSLTMSGHGDLMSSEDGIIAIGSGGMYALSAARALATVPSFTAYEIAVRAMRIAADICVYTNSNFVIETLDDSPSSSRLSPVASDAKPVEISPHLETAGVSSNPPSDSSGDKPSNKESGSS
jgi:ATP-dependent HslUV protease subunit HslV